MTPEQAIRILDDATSRLTLNRADHITISKALETLENLVKGSKENKNAD